jgi:hypothetical protein
MSGGASMIAIRSPAISAWAIILPWRSRTATSSPLPDRVMMSGMQTIVISSTAARPPMPLRRATSPSKSLDSTFSGAAAGVDSV